jgi:carboxylate-amine ligase
MREYAKVNVLVKYFICMEDDIVKTFNPSKEFSIGVELELQIVNNTDYNLEGMSGVFLKKIDNDSFNEQVKPEVTQSMLEINSSVHTNPQELYAELKEIRDMLTTNSKGLNILFSSGGAHPFQLWNETKVYPTPHYKNLAAKYGYLMQMYTVFGLHIHIGCENGDMAIYLLNTLPRFIPQLIALSASSPFWQGVDTQFASSRSNISHLFPLNGLAPSVSSWEEFNKHLEKMQAFKIVEDIDNFYWDIRPKPNYGTVEIRVCDAPLKIEQVALFAAYARILAYYLIKERPFSIIEDKYHLYRHNRFQAARYGFKGIYINPYTEECNTIAEDILDTCERVTPYAAALGDQQYIEQIKERVIHEQNDAKLIRNLFTQGKSLPEIVRYQADLFAGNITADF